MTLLNENVDAQSIDPSQGAMGPRVGFMDGFETSFNQSTKSAAQFGIDTAMANQNNEQINALRAAGEQNLPTMQGDNMAGTFGSVADFYENGGDPDQAARYKAYDDHIDELKLKYPKLNLQNTRELWDGTKATAVAAEAAAQKMQQTGTTTGGSIGDFLGGSVGGVDPLVNPVGFMTAPIGGIGKSIAARVISQAAGQGIASAIEQVGGVQGDRKLLGLSNGFSDAAGRVVSAAAGGAAGQGIGEAIGAGLKFAGKRWFRDVPGDRAPPPPDAPPIGPVGPAPGTPEANARSPEAAAYDQRTQDFIDGKIDYNDLLAGNSPFGNTRMAAARTILDTDHVAMQLDDWQGDYPGMVTPKSVLDIPNMASDGLRFQADDLQTRAALGRVTVDEAARIADPKAFAVFDALASQKTELRDAIASLQPDPVAARTSAAEAAAQIDKLEQRISGLDVFSEGGTPPKIAAKIADLKSQRNQMSSDMYKHMFDAIGGDTADMAAARQKLVDLDTKMRDLAPVVSRAYARVRGEWQLPPDYHGAVRRMVNEGGTTVGPTHAEDAPTAPAGLPPETLAERAPILQGAERVADQLGQHADAADIAKKIVADNQKTMDEALEKFRSDINTVLKPEGENQIRIAGTDLTLNLDDKIAIPQESGEGTRMATVRELLEENQRAAEDQKAVSSCSP